MLTFNELYYKTLKNAFSGGRIQNDDEPGAPRMIQCLAKPEAYPLSGDSIKCPGNDRKK